MDLQAQINQIYTLVNDILTFSPARLFQLLIDVLTWAINLSL